MRDILTSPRLEDIKRKRKARIIRLIILFGILFLSIFGALAYFSSYHRVTIHTVEVTGNRIINTTDVQTVVTNDISGRYIHLFSRANILIYPKGKIYKDLITAFPRIQSLDISLDRFNTLHIDLVERQAAFLYCGASIPAIPTDVGENCFFINNDGYIFDKAPYFSGNVYFKYYMKLPGSDTRALGSQMLPQDQFHALASFIDKITSLGFKPIYLSENDDGIDTLYLDNGNNPIIPQIIFKAHDDLPTILSNLTTAMAQPEFANDIHSKYATLLYIDLRFTDKVLYKFQ